MGHSSLRRKVVDLVPIGREVLKDIEELLPDTGYPVRKAAFNIYEAFFREQINSLEERLRSGRVGNLVGLFYLEPYFSPGSRAEQAIIDKLQDLNVMMMARMQEAEPISPRYSYVFDAVNDRYLVYHTFED